MAGYAGVNYILITTTGNVFAIFAGPETCLPDLTGMAQDLPGRICVDSETWQADL